MTVSSKEIATHTANGMFCYDREFYGRPLGAWVQDANRAMAVALGWTTYKLRPGAFGFDNCAVSIGMLLDSPLPTDPGAAARTVHDGWCTNYRFWRDNSPFDRDPCYLRPFHPLGDERRDLLLETPYDELPEEEKRKDAIIVEYILGEIKRSEA